jgi:hypothetical protein
MCNEACAMIECVQHPESAGPPTATQHVRDTLATAPSGLHDDAFDDMSGLAVAESTRPHMQLELGASLLQDDDLQQLLGRTSLFKICVVTRVNKADRAHSFKMTT